MAESHRNFKIISLAIDLGEPSSVVVNDGGVSHKDGQHHRLGHSRHKQVLAMAVPNDRLQHSHQLLLLKGMILD